VPNIITCAVTECERPSRKLKMCTMHYDRWTKHGSTDKPVVERQRVPVEKRFWPKVAKGDGCWTWTGSTNGVGYGKIHDGKQLVYAHRLSWQLANGPIPDLGIIDHMCHNATCVNPEHLRLVTKRQNVEHRKGAASNSKTGHRNISYTYGKYRVRVNPGGKSTHVGSYATLEEAIVAAEEARRTYFTHAD